LRYLQVPTVTFVTAEGVEVSLKDIRPPQPRASSFTTIPCDAQTSLEEVASRPEVYGAGFEGQAYQIFEENQVELFEARFDLSRVEKLRVPL